MTEGMYWHAYHGGELVFWVNYEERVAIIKLTKPTNEQPQHLAWMRPVTGELPAALVEAGKANSEANKAFSEACKAFGSVDSGESALRVVRRAYIKMNRVWRTVYAEHRELIEALHAEECSDCSWDAHRNTLVFDELGEKPHENVNHMAKESAVIPPSHHDDVSA